MRRVLLRFKFPFFGGCGKKSNQSLLIARTRFHDPLLDSYTETMQTKKKSKQGETVKKGVPSSLLVHLCHLFPCYFGSEGIDSNFDFIAICRSFRLSTKIMHVRLHWSHSIGNSCLNLSNPILSIFSMY